MKFHPIFADGGGTVLFIGIVVGVILIGIVIWGLMQTSHRVVLGAPSGTSVAVTQSIPVTAVLQIKTWAFGSWTNEDAAFTVSINAVKMVLGPTPRSGATVSGAPATINVTGLAPGSDSLTVIFTIPGTTTTAQSSAPLTVTGG